MSVLVIFVLSFLAELVLPWWSIAVVAFLVGAWKPSSGWKAFGAGFLGVSALWFIAAEYIHLHTGGVLTTRVAEMFKIPIPFLLVVMTAVLGGLVGALAATTGFHFKKVLEKA